MLREQEREQIVSRSRPRVDPRQKRKLAPPSAVARKVESDLASAGAVKAAFTRINP